MLAEQKTKFIKMSAAGNDFVIFDARSSEINLTKEQIAKISTRSNIGCDQLIIIHNSNSANCFIKIYNSDGSEAGACGNVTRCVAGILFEENSDLKEVKIETISGILPCKKEQNLILVNMGKPKLNWQDIPLSHEANSQNLEIQGYKFMALNIGNPHAVHFMSHDLSDEAFLKLGPMIENNEIFLEKTNVEFVQIIDDNLIKVRVWERGAGETLACGSGACAVGYFAIKNNLVSQNKVITQFKGGNIEIEVQDDDSIIMKGDYKKIYSGQIDESFL